MTPPDPSQHEREPAAMGLRPFLLASALAVLLFFGGLTAWSIAAPLATGVMAPARLAVSGNRVTVQHLEGGIVGTISVRDGDRVAAGDLLVTLDDTQARAERDMVGAQLVSLVAELARLQAERDGLEALAPPIGLLASMPGITIPEQILVSQRRILAARRQHLKTQAQITDQRIAQLREEITGLHSEIAAQRRQLDLIAEEETAKAELVRKGHAPRPDLLALQRRHAEIQGAIAKNQAAIARAEQAIGEARYSLENRRAEYLTEVVERIREAETDIADHVERHRAVTDIVARSEIRAPVTGIVVDVRGATLGGVLAPADAVLDIVPQARELVVEARISPTDVENVQAGQAAEVRLTGFRMDEVPPIQGQVRTVSADALEDERTGETYFRAEVAFAMPEDWAPERRLSPGMPAEVLVVQGSRTALSYLVEPLARSLSRAWREI